MINQEGQHVAQQINLIGNLNLIDRYDLHSFGVIRITRKTQFVGAGSAFEIFIDHYMVGTIGVGEKKTYKVIPGEHTLYIEGGRFSPYESPHRKVSVDAGHVAGFKCSFSIIDKIELWPDYQDVMIAAAIQGIISGTLD